jgi:type I restriction enzyme M protein
MNLGFFKVSPHSITLVRDNYLDAVIGLPKDIFFGTRMATYVLVFKKNRCAKSVLFIDAKDEFVKKGRLNELQKHNSRSAIGRQHM